MNTAVAPAAPSLDEKQVTAWLQEIECSKKREKNWRGEAVKMVALYEGYKRDQSPFNILYSNTETLSPALYNNTPRPAVNRRFKDKDPLGAAVALTMNRTLIFGMDNNDAAEPDFDSLMEHGILQALVPGRGAVRYKYDADVTIPEVSKDTLPDTPAEGEAAQEVPLPTVKNERIVGETVEYDRIVYGYAKKWSQVPWVAFEHHMTQDECERNFGKEKGAKVKCAEMEQEGESTEDKDSRKVAVIFEIWDKAHRCVYFVSPGYKEGDLKSSDDPLQISGFFPCAEPLHFLGKISSMVPQPVYNLYREQAEELNLITRRITAVMQAIKVRGAYDSTVTELKNILEQDDNGMVAVENCAAFADGKSFKDIIFLLPLAELVSVLQQLYLQRTQIKQVIYEITGISDILRGSSVASETATAQNIKNQWGTLRLKAMQKKVSRWAKANLRIMAEIAAKNFAQETFQRMTQLPYVTQAEQQQAQLERQQKTQQVAMAAQQAEMMGQPAPPVPEEDPRIAEVLATPTWEDIVALMRDQIGMDYRIDIETNSTIADDMAEDQKNIGELLNALSQFLNGVAPLIENGTMPFEVAKTMMLGIVRKMQMGPEVEDQLDKMQPPKPPEAEAPPPPPPVDPNIELKAQAEQAKIRAEIEKMNLELELEKERMALEREKMNMERQSLMQKMAYDKAKHEQGLQALAAKAAMPKKEPATTGD